MEDNKMPPPVKAFTFDVFGTVVDWRTSIISALTTAATSKLSSPSLSPTTRSRLASTDWSVFAAAWRAAYYAYTHGFVPGQTPWRDIDAFHRDALVDLLSEHGLSEVFTEDEITSLSRAWHFLTPWPDSAEGIRRLSANGGYRTATLSNGNVSLLKDLDEHGGLGFTEILSAEDFRMYKPNPGVYDGACERLKLAPGEVAMVAAHLGDLEAARARGMRTVYVEREGEEGWDEGRVEEARTWVDVWVGLGEGGVQEVARRFGA
ncbi:HAD-like domain-containing protein [Echria macrotheca]|uniref:HAD-like domain-containing protein n=1 Tax=Echria macrotheca TaxID=438768 RepID=A0AAJ0F0X5_9PEZI|nr:HAD-like domain-containing protein [Echria macrotheca]